MTGSCICIFSYLKYIDRYELLSNYKNDFTGVVFNKRAGYYAGSNLITFNGDRKLQISTRYQSANIGNTDRSVKYLKEFLQYGDSVVKKASSFSVFVYRKNKEYIYVDVATQNE